MKNRRTSANAKEQWFICSDLVSIRWQRPGMSEEADSAVLEEIGPSGAVVQLETGVAPGTSLRLDCQGVRFDGVVRTCRKEQYLGYFAEITFTLGQQWSVDLYRPRHLLEFNIPEPHTAGHDHKDIARDGRWEDNIIPIDAPRAAAYETIRRVAQNLAVVCGEMELVEMEQCFTRFFDSAPQGILFGGFVSAYRSARESLTGFYELPVSPLRQACHIAMLLGGLPDEEMQRAMPVAL